MVLTPFGEKKPKKKRNPKTEKSRMKRIERAVSDMNPGKRLKTRSWRNSKGFRVRGGGILCKEWRRPRREGTPRRPIAGEDEMEEGKPAAKKCAARRKES